MTTGQRALTVKHCFNVLELRVELLKVGMSLILEYLDLLQQRVIVVLVLIFITVQLFVVVNGLSETATCKIASQMNLEVQSVGIAYERVDQQHTARLRSRKRENGQRMSSLTSGQSAGLTFVSFSSLRLNPLTME